MGKYEPLTTFLSAQTNSQVCMSFAEIERVIGTTLPPSAASHRAWWSNNGLNNVMTRAWLDAGFLSEQVDLPGRKLVFRRVKPTRTGHRLADNLPAGEASPKLALFGWLKGTVSVAPGTNLADPADPDWGRQSDNG